MGCDLKHLDHNNFLFKLKGITQKIYLLVFLIFVTTLNHLMLECRLPIPVFSGSHCRETNMIKNKENNNYLTKYNQQKTDAIMKVQDKLNFI